MPRTESSGDVSGRAPAAGPDRTARRRLRTRARILEAARHVFGRCGVEAASIAEIADRADVGVGSFYNHFRSKEELLGVVVADAVETLGIALDRRAATLSDPAHVVGTCVRHVVRTVERDPIWGWLVVRASQYMPQLVSGFVPRLGRDVLAGIASGRFATRDATVAVLAIGGGVLHVMQSMLMGHLGADADRALAEQVLRQLGLPRDEAAEIAARPLPELEEEGQ